MLKLILSIVNSKNCRTFAADLENNKEKQWRNNFMSRYAEIKNKANSLCNDPKNDYKSTEDLCVIMGEWADETTINRVCKWLDKQMCNKSYGIKVKDYQLVGTLLYDLKKAMEE